MPRPTEYVAALADAAHPNDNGVPLISDDEGAEADPAPLDRRRSSSLRSVFTVAMKRNGKAKADEATLLTAGTVFDIADYSAPMCVVPSSVPSGADGAAGHTMPTPDGAPQASNVPPERRFSGARAQRTPPGGPSEGDAAPSMTPTLAGTASTSMSRRFSGARAPRSLDPQAVQASEAQAAAPAAPHPPPQLTADSLLEMGFGDARVRAALARSGGDPVAALDWLLSGLGIPIDEPLDSVGSSSVASASHSADPACVPTAVFTPVGVPLGGPAAAVVPLAAATPSASSTAAASSSTTAASSSAAAASSSTTDSAAEVAPTAGDAPSTADTPPLVELVTLFERQLGLSGPLFHVVDEACGMLGVPRRGSAIHKASLCWRALGSPEAPLGAAGTSAGTSGASDPVIARPVGESEVAVANAADGPPPDAQPAAASSVSSAGSRAAGGVRAARGPSQRAVAIAPWTCAVCTFEHSSPSNIGFLSCEVCETPRPS